MSDKCDFRRGGSEYISELIAGALARGEREATVRGKMLIDKPVRIPSGFTLTLEDCHLRLADGCYSNIFVNEHHATELGRTLAGRDRNISILGKGSAILDGGEYNGLSERNQLKDGMPPIWHNNLVFFANVEGFRISGISCINQRWWALNFVYCSSGYIGNIHFDASDIGVDKNGSRYRGLIQERYDEALVKNADGVDIRQGCHDIVIENISGFTEDDSVAITGLMGFERDFTVEGLSSDIHGIAVRHIHTAAFCTNVRLLNQGGIRLYDVTVEDVRDTSEGSPRMDRGKHAVRIGDPRLYGERHATAEETHNITVRGVRSRAMCAISLAGEIAELSIEDVEIFDGAELISDHRPR